MNLDSLLGAIGAAPDLPGAACRGKHHLFDLRDLSDPERPDVEDRALEICRSCSAAAACGSWIASTAARLLPHGVVAGAVRRPGPPRSRTRKAVA